MISNKALLLIVFVSVFLSSSTTEEDCFIEIHNGDEMTGYQEGEDITLYLEHNCTQHSPVCTWDNRSNKIEISTESQNISPTGVESTLTINGTDVVVGAHSVFCSLANNKTVSTLVTVTTSTPSPTLTPSSPTIRQTSSIIISSILDSPRPTATGSPSPTCEMSCNHSGPGPGIYTMRTSIFGTAVSFLLVTMATSYST